MKRIIARMLTASSLLLSAVLLALVMTACSSDPKPSSASDFDYEVNENGTGILINKYIGESQDVVIPAEIDGLPVVSLRGIPDKENPDSSFPAEGVFENTSVKTVFVPKTVTRIDFSDCKELTKVTFQKESSLEYIGWGVFSGCENLLEIDLSPTKVKIIGWNAFNHCTSLERITFPDTLETIEERAFYECSSLVEVDLPESLLTLETQAFGYCTAIERIVIPTKVDLFGGINGTVFEQASALKCIEFREGREEIDGYALVRTDACLEIIVPASVKRFSAATFFVHSTTPITITFKGDAPEIIKDNDPNGDCLNHPIIRYDPKTDGWDSFEWNEIFDVMPIT